jgi:hypothetical protein
VPTGTHVCAGRHTRFFYPEDGTGYSPAGGARKTRRAALAQGAGGAEPAARRAAPDRATNPPRGNMGKAVLRFAPMKGGFNPEYKLDV